MNTATQRCLMAAGMMAVGLAASGAHAAASCKQTLSTNDRVVALQAVQNLMGRYSHLAEEHGEGTLGDLFAMKTEGVSWKSPRGPDGIAAMKDRFARPSEDPLKYPGQLHMHSMFTPVIEIAADGKTAQGVWDSFGPGVQTVSSGAGWLWVKYGVDFVKEDGEWKIWHLQVFPIFSTPYEKSLTTTALEHAAGPPPPPPGDMPAATQHWSGPKDALWIYDGKTPLRGPHVPEPYCSFDPAKSSAQYDGN